MKGLLVNEYSKVCSDGQRRTFYVYKISGKATEIQDFTDSEAAKTTDEEGNNLWITSRYGGENAKLVITKDGRVTFDQSEMRKVAALAGMFGEAGKGILADYINRQLKSNVVAETAEVAEQKDPVDDL